MSPVRVTGEDDVVLLRVVGTSRVHPLRLAPGKVATPFGVLDAEALIGRAYGSKHRIGEAELVMLPLSNEDIFRLIRRKAQVITPKDAARIIFHTSIRSGSKVAECGTGSGALTVYLARMVAPTGMVYSYDTRDDHIRTARENASLFGAESCITFIMKDVREGLEQKDLDAVVTDIPEPWAVLEHAFDSLVPGGHIACFLPTFGQIERTVRAMRETFADVRAWETIERGLHVGERSARPETRMLGHTGFIATGRKVV